MITVISALIFAVSFAVMRAGILKMKDKHSDFRTIQYKVSQSVVVSAFAFQFDWHEMPFIFISFWIVFELVLNRLMGWPLFFVGTTGSIDKAVRWIGNKIGLHEQLTGILLKVLLITVALSILL